jgi:hypothetical protein
VGLARRSGRDNIGFVQQRTNRDPLQCKPEPVVFDSVVDNVDAWQYGVQSNEITGVLRE